MVNKVKLWTQTCSECSVQGSDEVELLKILQLCQSIIRPCAVNTAEARGWNPAETALITLHTVRENLSALL